MFKLDRIIEHAKAHRVGNEFEGAARKASSDGKIDEQERFALAKDFEAMTPAEQKAALEEIQEQVDKKCHSLPPDQKAELQALITTLEQVQSGELDINTLDPEYHAGSDAANQLAPGLNVDAAEELTPQALNFLVMASGLADSGAELDAAEVGVLHAQIKDWPPEDLAQLRAALLDPSRPPALQWLAEQLFAVGQDGTVTLKEPAAPTEADPS